MESRVAPTPCLSVLVPFLTCQSWRLRICCCVHSSRRGDNLSCCLILVFRRLPSKWQKVLAALMLTQSHHGRNLFARLAARPVSLQVRCKVTTTKPKVSSMLEATTDVAQQLNQTGVWKGSAGRKKRQATHANEPRRVNIASQSLCGEHLRRPTRGVLLKLTPSCARRHHKIHSSFNRAAPRMRYHRSEPRSWALEPCASQCPPTSQAYHDGPGRRAISTFPA